MQTHASWPPSASPSLRSYSHKTKTRLRTRAGLRWTLSQILLQKATLGLENPAAAILFMMPMMAGVLTPLSLLTEAPLQARTP